jgi:tetratricopeptide (TPR) repeat protein
MNRVRLLFVLACVGGLVAASGCSQGSWAWLDPRQKSSDLGEEAGTGGIAGLGSSAKSDPKAPKNPFALARLSERQGQTGKAEQLYQEILKKSPNHAGAHHRLGVLYARQGKMSQAEEHFARALALKPDFPELLSDAGYFYYLTGRPQEAERCLRRALELEPANRKYCTNLALAVAEQGRHDEAYTLFRQAGSEKEATANMAFVLAQQGNYQQALSLYDRVLTEDPSMRVAADAMIELSKRLEQKPQVAVSSGPKESGTIPPSPAAAAGSDEAAASRANSLVTVSEGRAVPPPWATRRDPVAGPPSAPPTAFPSDPAPVNRDAFAAENTPPSTVMTLAEQRPTGGTSPGIAAGVPCAYLAPGDRGSTPPQVKRAEAETAYRAPSETAATLPLRVAPPSVGPASPPEVSCENRPAHEVPLFQNYFQPSTLALLLGMVLMGTSAFAWLRRGRRRRAVAAGRARRLDQRVARSFRQSGCRASPIAIRRARA